MKVLITTDLFKPIINGVVTSVINLEEELIKQGHEVRILTVSNSCKSYQEDHIYHIMSMALKIYPDVRLPISRGESYVQELIAWNPDVIHSQCEFFSFGFAKRIARETDAVLIHTYHTLYEQYTEYIPIMKSLGTNSIAKWMRRRLKCVDKIIVPTEKVRKSLKEYGIAQDMDVIPSGIKLTEFQASFDSGQLKALKDKYQIPEGKKLLLSLGRLGVEKRVEELLYGLKNIVEIRNDIMLLIVGDGPAKEQLLALTVELKLENHVRFTGMVKPQEVAIYYQLADGFICASTSETQGLTYIEAIASGLPLFCRKDPCLNEVLEDGVNGYAYETIEEFASLICNKMSDKKWMEAAKNHSRKIAGRYGTEGFGRLVIEEYRKTIRKEKRGKYEDFIICKKQTNRIKKWCGACYAYARRVT